MYAILNPANDLYWCRDGFFTSERSGQYTTYATAAHAELAIRRTRALKRRGFVVVPEPAHERALQIQDLQARG